LVFVFAITQLSRYLLHHLTLQGAARTLFLLVVWWAWIYTTWMANWFDPDSVPVRLTLLVGMLASLAMAIAVPQAFGSRALLFVWGYVGLQVMRNAFIVAATRPESPLHPSDTYRTRVSRWAALVGARAPQSNRVQVGPPRDAPRRSGCGDASTLRRSVGRDERTGGPGGSA
jgi:low temperature requirement protein LtrA